MAAEKPARRDPGEVGQQPGSSRRRSAILQVRVDEEFARALLEEDAVVLGLDGPSALVREGLRLVHERAREATMAAAYDQFYGGERAPLPTGAAPEDRE